MNETYAWYQTLVKPTWAPPAWLFGPVWTLLYILIAISFGRVFYLIYKNKLKKKVAIPFILNIAFNLAFTPIQFGLKNNLLAATDVILVLLTLIWAIRQIPKKERWAFYLLVPYLLWVCFATILQLTITYLNFPV